MKRTSSGSDLSSRAIFDNHASTPYVYLAPAKQQSGRSISSPRNGTSPADFRVHCGGGTVRFSHRPPLALPSFIAEVAADFLVALHLPLGGDSVFSIPLGCISRCRIRQPEGANAHVWSFLCGCCFGHRDRVLELELDAPAGWLQAEPGLAGPALLCLFVRECAPCSCAQSRSARTQCPWDVHTRSL